jgi:hypothetical protein
MRKLSVLLILAFIGCVDKKGINTVTTANGYAPIYAKINASQDLTVTAARATTNAGKIFAFGDFIFQNELGQGIHIIDNTNKANPKKIGFINILYSSEVVIKDKYLYANSLSDLVVFELSTTKVPVFIKRIPGVFTTAANSLKFPAQRGFYFECVDDSKGIVVGWEQKIISNPKCYR